MDVIRKRVREEEQTRGCEVGGRSCCCGTAALSRAMVSHARGPEFDSASGLHPPCHGRNAVAWSYTSGCDQWQTDR